MKQQIIELKKKLLIVELPEGILSEPDYITRRTFTILELELTGKLTDITESQYSEWVQLISNGKFTGQKQYRKYSDTTDIPANMWVKTAKESFFSKLLADEIYFQNYLEEPIKMEYNFSHGHNEINQYKKDLKRWQEAESKVWDINKCYLFQILK